MKNPRPQNNKMPYANRKPADAYFSRRDWFQLPEELRAKWWRETDYNAKEPSAALIDEMNAAIAARNSGS